MNPRVEDEREIEREGREGHHNYVDYESRYFFLFLVTLSPVVNRFE